MKTYKIINKHNPLRCHWVAARSKRQAKEVLKKEYPGFVRKALVVQELKHAEVIL